MAVKLLEFESEEGKVLIGVPAAPGMIQPTGRLEDSIESINGSLGQALCVVAAVGKSFRGVFEEAGADGGELELGLQFTAKGTVYVVEATGQATLKVKLSFNRKG